MKRNLTLIFSLFLSLSVFSQRKCFTDEYVASQLKKHPELLLQKKAYEKAIENNKNNSHYSKSAAPFDIQIPVVFHVVYRTAQQNVPDARIFEQIERLNEDFLGKNADTANVPDEFKSFIANTKIRFFLAETDPSGNPTTGITRTSTDEFTFSIDDDGIKSSDAGGKDAWDTDDYLNIWIGNIDSQILGYALPPFAAGSDNDGVVISYRNIGNNNNGIYDKGRTAVHEVGHYLGLDHVWGNGAGGCIQDDGIADTPMQSEPHYGVNSHPLPTCGSNDMFMNFMDYGNDEALVMFSKGQRTRMELVLGGVRNGLGVIEPLSVDHDVVKANFSLFPNPSEGEINIQFENIVENGKISVLDISGREYYSKSISDLEQMNIDLGNLTNGLYFVNVFDGSTSSQRKVIIKK